MPALQDSALRMGWLSSGDSSTSQLYESLFGSPASDLKVLMDAQPQTASIAVSNKKWKGGGRARGASARRLHDTGSQAPCRPPDALVSGITEKKAEMGNYRMILSILESGEPRGARMLLSRLVHPSAMVRRAALDALESTWFLLAPDQSTSEMEDSDSSPPSSRPSSWSHDGGTSCELSLEFQQRDIKANSHSPTVRIGALARKLLQVVHDEDRHVRRRVAKLLELVAPRQHAAVVKALASAMDQESDAASLMAFVATLRAVAGRGDSSAVAALLAVARGGALFTRSRDVRRVTVSALGRLAAPGDCEALAVALGAMDDADEMVRYYAVRAVEDIGEEGGGRAMSKLISLVLVERDPLVWHRAVAALDPMVECMQRQARLQRRRARTGGGGSDAGSRDRCCHEACSAVDAGEEEGQGAGEASGCADRVSGGADGGGGDPRHGGGAGEHTRGAQRGTTPTDSPGHGCGVRRGGEPREGGWSGRRGVALGGTPRAFESREAAARMDGRHGGRAPRGGRDAAATAFVPRILDVLSRQQQQAAGSKAVVAVEEHHDPA